MLHEDCARRRRRKKKNAVVLIFFFEISPFDASTRSIDRTAFKWNDVLPVLHQK